MIDYALALLAAFGAGVWYLRLVRVERERLRREAEFRKAWEALGPLQRRRIIVNVTADVREFTEALERVGRAIAAAQPSVREFAARLERLDPKRRT